MLSWYVPLLGPRFDIILLNGAKGGLKCATSHCYNIQKLFVDCGRHTSHAATSKPASEELSKLKSSCEASKKLIRFAGQAA